MSRIQYEITRHTKKQGNGSHNEKKTQATGKDPQVTQTVELANKNLKTVI